MPVIVIGADTPQGPAVIEALMGRVIEVRAFISDPEWSARLRTIGAKVATGDVSDGSHIEAASLGCFCAIVLAAAAGDNRERSFATDTASLYRTWLDALSMAKLSRIIWVEDSSNPTDGLVVAEAARDLVLGELLVIADGPDLPQRVASLEETAAPS